MRVHTYIYILNIATLKAVIPKLLDDLDRIKIFKIRGEAIKVVVIYRNGLVLLFTILLFSTVHLSHLPHVGNHCSRHMLKFSHSTHLLVLSYASPCVDATKHLGIIHIPLSNKVTITTILLNHFY